MYYYDLWRNTTTWSFLPIVKITENSKLKVIRRMGLITSILLFPVLLLFTGIPWMLFVVVISACEIITYLKNEEHKKR